MHGTARRVLAVVVALVATTLLAAPAPAIDVDPTYGQAGVAAGLPAGVALEAAAVQPDGKVVVGGSIFPTDWFVARFTASGRLDPTFGGAGTGMRTINLTGGSVSESVTAVAIAPDGKIVLAGYSDVSQTTVILRMLADGTPDATYAGDGADYVDFGSAGSAKPAGVAVQPDGRIVVVSEVGFNGATSTIGVARLDTTGVLDGSFSADGRITTTFSFGGIQTPYELLLQPDGRVLVAGHAQGPGGPDFGFLRLTSAGDPDPSFDLDGRAVVDLGDESYVRALGLLSDGRIAAAGHQGGSGGFTVALLTPSGTPDPSFDGDGRALHDVGDDFPLVNALVVQPGDRIVVSGTTGPLGFDRTEVLLRVTTSGARDATFSGDGVVTRTSASSDPPVALGLRPNGSLVATSRQRVAHVLGFLPGYWMASADGEVFPFGASQDLGDATAILGAGVRLVELRPSPSQEGYYVLDSIGRVHAFGDAVDRGDVDLGVLAPGEVVSSLSVTPDGGGYWVFTSRGRVLTFGNAPFLGDVTALPLNGPVLGSIPTPSGAGYYMVASDGGIFAFGDAAFRGSMGGIRLNQPVQGLVPTADNGGYWLVASDGGIFAFGNADFRGSMGATPLNQPVVGMVRYGNGYLMVASDGGIFSFSDQPFVGSLGANPPASPVVTAAAVS